MMNNSQQQRMASRMGLYKSGITDAHGMTERLEQRGGTLQQQRIIRGKYLSFCKALSYSYQGAFIRPVEQDEVYRALINPDKNKLDYDDKIISVDFKHNLSVGDVFEWVDTNTYWLIYLQELTELAYFRGEIRKCEYTVDWLDDDGNLQSTYVAVRGPVETRIESVSKENISTDIPNFSVLLYVPKNEATLAYFKRYRRFYLQEDQSTCWRIEGVDYISTPGIIELTAVEYYSDPFYDENGVVDALRIKPIPDGDEISEIEGQTFIKPKVTNAYTYTGDEPGEWSIVETGAPVTLEVLSDTVVQIKWTANYSGHVTLQCGDATKTIVVESLF